MSANRIVGLACLSFEMEYAVDPRRAVARLQALLRNEMACATRLALLTELSARHANSPTPINRPDGDVVILAPELVQDLDGQDERFARIADTIKDRRLGRALAMEDVAPGEIDKLLGDPKAIQILHEGLVYVYVPASVTQVLVEEGWAAVDPIFPLILDAMQERARVRRRDAEDFQNCITGEMKAFDWQYNPPGRFRDVLREKVNAWLVRHRKSELPEIDWDALAENVSLRGGLRWLKMPELQEGPNREIVYMIARAIEERSLSVSELYQWTEAARTRPVTLREVFSLRDRHPLATAREVCDHLMEEIQKNLSSARDVLGPSVAA